MKPIRLFSIIIILFFISVSSVAQTAITLDVDATEAARNLVHSRLTLPVKPGPLTLFYPKWIPGEHTPTGTIDDVVGLKLSAAGRPIAWRRDDVEMFAFHCEIPAGVTTLNVSFDDVSQPETTASAKLARLKWNRVLLYPEGMNSDAVNVKASLKLPQGWKFASALPITNENNGELQFKEVTLTQLVDSPAIIGANFRNLPLTSTGIKHELDLMADTPAALELKPETLAGLQKLVQEAYALFGARHYRSYQFLVTLSDHGGSEGLEHHESSEDGVGENAFSDELELLDFGDLMGHEYAHSWNGKYRRPAGLATPDFQQPMKGELLWVYEGLTTYLGTVLTARSGLWTLAETREYLATVASALDHRAGRRWRSLQNTSNAAQILYFAPSEWSSYRRTTDFYAESVLIWLEADVTIRKQTQGRRSLDDFCRAFLGGPSDGPTVKTYTFDELISELTAITPFDWRTFFRDRLQSVSSHAPLGGITGAGWRLVYNDEPNVLIAADQDASGKGDFTASIGLVAKADGSIEDSVAGMAASQAGLSPYMKIIGVNGSQFSVDDLKRAIQASKSNAAPIIIISSNTGSMETHAIPYHDGLRSPHLQRVDEERDYLNDILKPLTSSAEGTR